MNATEHQLREIAYQIWESEGKPYGQAARHWDMACKLGNPSSDNATPVKIVANPAHISSQPIKEKKSRKKTVPADDNLKPSSVSPAVEQKGQTRTVQNHLK